ncbi:Hypothetical predicted protein [Octopus vulgaris]|uniref:CS domain-containing protein n=1 Tax=Octopus vulgaris TaxID=6645 RepID=A0AA36B648_OCTVU|nr:Hypothetical predicted protein [Octopus vulgaris]
MANTEGASRPNVSWAQRRDKLLITIHVADCVDPKIRIAEGNILKFEGEGGPQKQSFKTELKFYKEVKDEFKQTIGGRELNLVIKKVEENWWPRLLLEEKKQHHLKTDFTRWKDEDDSDTDEPDDFNLKDMMNKMGGVEDGEEVFLT